MLIVMYLFRNESKSKVHVDEGKCSSNDVDFGSQGVRFLPYLRYILGLGFHSLQMAREG